MAKPIRVFWSELGKRFYASSHYKINGNVVTITGAKYDVTDDIGSAIIKHDLEFKPVEEQPHERTQADDNQHASWSAH